MSLAQEIGRHLNFSREELKQTNRAAYLAKSDLESRVVYEFPELQGVIGEYYARAAGEDPVVAQAIREHYLPRFAGDELPQSRPGLAVALADKLDSLSGFFACGLIPTGSQDPFALRRAAAGCAQIIIVNDLDLPIRELLTLNFHLLKADAPPAFREKMETGRERAESIIQFLEQRVENIMSEQGIAYDVVNAVSQIGLSRADLAGAFRRARALNQYRANAAFAHLRAGFTRSVNILRSAAKSQSPEELPQVRETLFVHDSERALHEAAAQTWERVRPLLAAGDYQAALDETAKLTPLIDAFFEAVMVLDKDEEVRKNRMSLLREITSLTQEIGDISQIVD